jgi:hypothetical protein
VLSAKGLRKRASIFIGEKLKYGKRVGRWLCEIQRSSDSRYLISLEYYAETKQKAQELNLSPRQWKYVPPLTVQFHWEAIKKYHGMPPDHLIGAFNEDEFFI